MGTGAATEASERYNARARAEGWASVCDAELAFQRLEFRVLIATWRAIAANHMPSRRDFTPRNLKSLLRNVAIYERVTNGKVRWRVRLMGTAFSDVMGDLTGKFLDEAIPPEHLCRWHAALEAAMAAGAPLRFISRADSVGQPFMVGEYFEAPILNDDGQPNMILAAGLFAPRHWADVMAREPLRHAAAAA
ncbi:MAG TPA: PAS domain-containing protein [Rhizomicrobium sp.]|nr:PAS domain-containing protein [Rhizomicrobium sp.]